MPDEPIDRILDAAYACFARHGVRRTTMDDIAAAAAMSRPAVYQYVRNKDDAFRRLGTRLFDGAVAQAVAAVAADASLADRLHAVLAAKLELTLKLWRDSPHAAELLDAGARLSGGLVEDFTAAILDLLTNTIEAAAARGEVDLHGTDASEIAHVTLSLIYGLEVDIAHPDRLRHRLRLGVNLLVGGLAKH
ncbi:TetR/AcrR family transcriptional regulator [Actinokineospora sp.]|uniref:TetR/AcrR family transcriptional regulator n=1 Tax=Actinokineospora sp. TaxID=1872133 RepID=UPI0040381B7F